ncbi:MAG: hypothetical protein ACI9K1_001419 [Arcticibacterium sp.]|jgi:hypothetical protein
MNRFLIIPVLLICANLSAQQSLVELKGENGKLIRKLVNDFQNEHEEFDGLEIAPFIYIIDNSNRLKFLVGYSRSLLETQKFPPMFYYKSEIGLPIYIYSQVQTVFSLSNEHKNEMVNVGKGFIDDGARINIRYYFWYAEIKNGKVKKIKKKTPNRIFRDFDSFMGSYLWPRTN